MDKKLMRDLALYWPQFRYGGPTHSYGPFKPVAGKLEKIVAPPEQAEVDAYIENLREQLEPAQEAEKKEVAVHGI